MVLVYSFSGLVHGRHGGDMVAGRQAGTGTVVGSLHVETTMEQRES